MKDIAERSRQAREKLAQALELLQSPEAGDLIDTVAEPVARSMGALHGIEESGGSELSKNAPLAFSSVRKALGVLQTAPLNGASVRAIAHIASSLVLVYELIELSKAPEEAPSPGGKKGIKSSPGEKASLPPPGPAVVEVKVQQESEPAPAAPSGGFDVTMPIKTAESVPPRVSALETTQPSVRPPGVSRAATLPASALSSKAPPPPDGGIPKNALQIEVELGTHSATNFYQGLGSEDVIEDGGLFVETYEIPALGAQLWLTVHMPGGYEFQAVAQVRWSRAMNVGDAPPGFGCKLVILSSEARKLIHRYTKNRQPFFHDE